MCNGTSKFGISKGMQESMRFIGQLMTYKEGSEAFKKLLNVNVCAPQIQRICVHYAEQLDEKIKSNDEEYIPTLEKKKR